MREREGAIPGAYVKRGHGVLVHSFRRHDNRNNRLKEMDLSNYAGQFRSLGMTSLKCDVTPPLAGCDVTVRRAAKASCGGGRERGTGRRGGRGLLSGRPAQGCSRTYTCCPR